MPLDISVSGQIIAATTSASSHALTNELVAGGTSLMLYNPGPNVVRVTSSLTGEGAVDATATSVPILPATLVPVRKSASHDSLSVLSVGGNQSVYVFPA